VKTLTFKKKNDKEITEEDIELTKFTDIEIKENFPALYKELSGEGTSSLSAEDAKELLGNDLQSDSEVFDNDESEINLESEIDVKTTNKPMEKDYLRGFNPQAIDFIRRAKTNDEALEVINYLQKRGEITSDHCEQLKLQLKEQGLESFGEHKQDGYYFEYQRKKHLEEKMKLIGKQPIK